eukprot:Opistho-2@84249
MAIPINDISMPAADVVHPFLATKHVDYLGSFRIGSRDYEQVMTAHLRMSGIYWTITTLDVLNSLDKLPRADIVAFVRLCQRPSGGFAAGPGHDEHLLYTLSAVQILCTYNAVKEGCDADAVVAYVKSLQQADGSFAGDRSAAVEIDSRFSFCALACLSLLGRLDDVDMDAAVAFIVRCRNFDGGFGRIPGSESHAGQVFCCVGALAIAESLRHIDRDQLGWWLCERQLSSGGLNGRPEKLPDVCYSWWVLSALAIIDRLHWIDQSKLRSFILAAQDAAAGGIADRPGDIADPFHTLFGTAGLSLMGEGGLKKIDPVYCLAAEVVAAHAKKRERKRAKYSQVCGESQ